MRKYLYYTILLIFLLLSHACSKGDETSGNLPDPPEQTAGIERIAQLNNPVNPIKEATVRDENGWYHDWNQGMAAAKKEKKPVLVDFYADWCKWCDVMDEKTFSNPEIQKIFDEDWITIRIDTQDTKTTGTFKDKTMTFRQMAGAFGVTGLPSYVFIDKKSEPVTVIPGYIPKEKFSKILDYMKNELYLDKVDFQEYVESNS